MSNISTFGKITHNSLLQAFDNSADPVAITDANLDEGIKFIYINKAFCEETGYEKKELIGKSPKILQGQRSNKKLLASLKEQLKKTGSFKGQTINYKKDGSEYIVKWTISELKDNNDNVIAYISFHKIITQFIKSRNENRLFQKIIEQVPSSIIITDLQANIIYANNSFLENIQYTKNELIGENARILKSGKQGVKYYEKMWQSLKNTGKFDGIFISSRKDGTFFYDKKTITLVKDEEGEAKYYVGVSHDITKLKEALTKR